MKKIIFLVSIFLLTACMTTPPSEIPKLKAQDLKTMDLGPLKGKSVQLNVHVIRKANLDAGNATVVEAALYQLISESLTNSDVMVDHSSKIHLDVTVADEKDLKGPGQCLRIAGVMNINPYFKLSMTGIGCFGYQDALFGDMGSNINETYKLTLTSFYKTMEEQVKQYQDKF